MQPFTTLDGLAAPLDRANVDTDGIVPKQFMKSIQRTRFRPNLFDEWRYLDHGEPGRDGASRPVNPDFVLNQPRYQGAQILLVRENFGCGSSREHAVWNLADFDIRALIGPSFADLFGTSCFKNGMVRVVVDAKAVDELVIAVQARPGLRMHMDLAAQRVTLPNALARESIHFAIDARRKQRLLDGLDDIALTLQMAGRIRAYEVKRQHLEPWLDLVLQVVVHPR